MAQLYYYNFQNFIRTKQNIKRSTDKFVTVIVQNQIKTFIFFIKKI